MLSVGNQYSNIQPKEEIQKKPKNQIKGSIAAIGASSVVPLAVMPIGAMAVNGMSHFSNQLNNNEVQAVNNAAQNIIDKVTNLGTKGVKILNFNDAEQYKMPNIPDFIQEKINPLYATAKGKNAAFLNQDSIGVLSKNTIIINKEKLSLASFHEIGHAFNFNNSAFWKTMQKMRTPGMAIGSTLALFAALTTTEKAQEGKELTTGQKVKNTIREKSPILAFAAMLPTLAEEGMASIRGCKWAKTLLDKNLANKVVKTNAVAYLSYLSGALGLSLSAYAAKKVKDNFTN